MCSDKNNTKIIHYGNDRDILRDGFELCLSQAFLGPVEIQLNDKEFVPLQFSYVDVETKEENHYPYGMVNFCCLVKDRTPLHLRIMVQFIEGIQIYPPMNDTNSTGAIIMKIARKGLLPLRRSLGISNDVAKSCPLSFPSTGDAFSSIIFILKPWNEVNMKHYLRLLTKPSFFRSFDELQIRFNKWLAIIREEDIKHLKSSQQWRTENPFIIEMLNTNEWFDIMKKNNLIADNRTNNRILKYKYYRPGQIPTVTLPKSRAVEIQSMFSSPEKKFDWLASIPRKDINIPAAKKNLENHATTKRPSMEHQAPIIKRKRNLMGQITIDDDEAKSSDDNQNRKNSQSKFEVATKCTTLLKYGSGKTSISCLLSCSQHSMIPLVSVGDVGKLSPEQLLNDSIIEFYLRFLAQECCPIKQDIYIFNTFLYSRLISHPTKSVTSTTLRSIVNRKAWLKKNYESVKRWTKDVDIFSKKILIIPVNYEDHWYVIIVQNPGKAIKEGSTLPANTSTQKQEQITPKDTCKIFIFNSLRMVKCSVLNVTCDVIKEYLALEFADKYQQKDCNFSAKHIVEVAVKDISGQRNLFDCGVFLLAYTELFLMWPPNIQNFVFNFDRKWPLFQETQMTRMRYKILMVLKSKVTREMWKRLEGFEINEHEDDSTTEQRLHQQLESRGIRRWQSQRNIRQKLRFKKRSKSLDRVDPEDHLNPTWDPVFE